MPFILLSRYDSLDVDFFFENYQGTFYLDVWDDTDIQDMGPTNDIYDIPFAPTSGWSTTKDAIATVGHTYVIWTWDNHFAKIRISNITNDRVVFDWAYQLVEGSILIVIIFVVGFPSNFINGSLSDPSYFSSAFGWGIVKSPIEFFTTILFVVLASVQIFRYTRKYLLSSQKIKHKYWDI